MARFVIPILLLILSLGKARTLLADSVAAPVVDLSTPLNTYGTYLEGRLADDLTTIKASVTASAVKKTGVDVMLKYDVARHKLEKIALSKFGADASKIILDTQRPIEDELLAQKKRLLASRADIDRDGVTAVLYLHAERNPPPGIEPFNEGIHFVKVGDLWKIDGVKLLHLEDQDDPDLAQQQRTAAALYRSIGDFMDLLTAGIKKGTYGSAAEVRAALDKQWDSLAPGAQGELAPAKPQVEEPKPQE